MNTSEQRSIFYNLGVEKPLSFHSNNYLIDQYLLEGWSAQEAHHRWTEGARASLQLHLPEIGSENITLQVECSGFLANGKLNHQTVDVLVNDQSVTTWEVSQQNFHEAVIPQNLIRDGNLRVTFVISHPCSPYDAKISLDKRNLGLSVNSLEIIESDQSSSKTAVTRSETPAPLHHLDPGEKLYFSGNIFTVDRYLLDGWSQQEQDCRWTEGERASLQFFVPAIGKQDLMLRVQCRVFLAYGKLSRQSVEVLVNDNKICIWTVYNEDYDELEASIPNELIGNGDVKITFFISNPLSAFEAGLSDDKRMLGLAIQSMSIEINSHSKLSVSNQEANKSDSGRGSLPFPPLNLRKSVGPIEKAYYEVIENELVFEDMVPPKNYESVFDFGCGCGRVARQLMMQSTAKPSRYMGVDLFKDSIIWCSQNLGPLNPAYRFHHLDVFNLQFNPHSKNDAASFPTDEKFSLIFASSVFTHITEPHIDHYLEECFRLLEAHGIFLATWFFFDKRGFPMMQESQNSLYINLDDPTNATIFDFQFIERKYDEHGMVIYKIIPPDIRGFQWCLLAAPKESGLPKAEFPDDVAPIGIAKAPV